MFRRKPPANSETKATCRTDLLNAGGPQTPGSDERLRTAPPAIELKGICKSFGAVRANRNIDLVVPQGTIHGIIGENGAGKSTLMSILYGFYEADQGCIEIGGSAVTIRSAQDAISRGIGMVHQHFMLIDTFSVLENVILGSEGGGLLAAGKKAAGAVLAGLARDYGLLVDINAQVGGLSVGDRQRVEILKALYRGARVLILDEPTGVLTPQETDQLFRILDALRQEGVTILLITHKLQEIMAITDGVSVMRAGVMVAHRKTAETNKEELAELMVGRKVRLDMNKQATVPGEVLLQARDLTVVDGRGVTRLDAVSLTLRTGEIVGVAGVSGNGQSELLEVLSGVQPLSGGSFTLAGREVSSDRPFSGADLRALGAAHIPEDRHRLGLVTRFSAAESAILGYQSAAAFNGPLLMDQVAVTQHCQDLMTEFDVRPPDPEIRSANLSGGNQQKLIIARELSQDPKVLLIGQPTRGVDIGAIEFIHRQIIARRDAGCAILMVSVELEEILSLADRILVMFEGRLIGEVATADADERLLGLMMANAQEAADKAIVKDKDPANHAVKTPVKQPEKPTGGAAQTQPTAKRVHL